MRTLWLGLLAALAGPALASGALRTPLAAAHFAPFIEAHRLASGGGGLLPLRLAPAPRLCTPVGATDPAPLGALIHNPSADARLARVAA